MPKAAGRPCTQQLLQETLWAYSSYWKQALTHRSRCVPRTILTMLYLCVSLRRNLLKAFLIMQRSTRQ